MYWNYRVLREEVEFMNEKHVQHKVITVYYDENHKIYGWSDTSETGLIWEELENLQGTVEQIKHAFDKPVLRKIKDDALVEIESEEV